MTEPRLPAAPTPEMIAAGVRALAPLWDMHTEGEMAEIATAVFSAMIALAPQPSRPEAVFELHLTRRM
jgi:diphthamide synthase (EF-2-diphthine--ammonia ligase)